MSTTQEAVGREGWIVVALSKAGQSALNAVQLQKVLFLLGERRRQAVGKGFYDFVPYNYGPFSRAIYDDADELINRGIIELDASGGRSTRTYRLTEAGRSLAEELERAFPGEGVQYLASAVTWAKGLTFDQLVRAIYEAFPTMRQNSVFQR